MHFECKVRTLPALPAQHKLLFNGQKGQNKLICITGNGFLHYQHHDCTWFGNHSQHRTDRVCDLTLMYANMRNEINKIFYLYRSHWREKKMQQPKFSFWRSVTKSTFEKFIDPRQHRRAFWFCSSRCYRGWAVFCCNRRQEKSSHTLTLLNGQHGAAGKIFLFFHQYFITGWVQTKPGALDVMVPSVHRS